MADGKLLTSDRETYSMVCTESLCCGKPIVGLNAGGPETISIPEYSSFVSYADTNRLYNTLVSMIKKANYIMDTSEALAIYSKESMAQAYLKSYEALLASLNKQKEF